MLNFLWPPGLFALALLPLMALAYGFVQRRRRRYAVRFTNLALLRDVAGPGPGARRHIPPALFALGLAAVLVGVARPVADLTLAREQSTVMLVMDVSASMTANDLSPNRIEAAKLAARAFVETLPAHVIVGVVAFSDHSTLASELTLDHARVMQAIDDLVPGGGTAIGDGLNEALDHLTAQPRNSEGKQPPSIVVLLSDGESQFGSPPAEASERAAGLGIKVYTVGIGERGRRVDLGSSQSAGLDEEALREMSRTTGAQYFYAQESKTLQDIYNRLSFQIGWVQERVEITSLLAGAGAALLALSGLLSLWWFQQLP